jgi:predicted PurR-regulated permease PerM
MTDSASSSDKNGFDTKALNALRLGLLFLIVYWCFKIVAPFLPLVIWGVIVAVAVYPLHRNLTERLGNRIKLSATLVTLLGLLILTTPVVVLTGSLVESSMGLASDIAEGTVEVPPPPKRVQEWPLVGEKLHSGWTQASQNLSVTLEKFGPQLELLRHRLIAIAGGTGAAFLQLFFSIVISGVFLATSKSSMVGARTVVNWLVGEEGPVMLHISESTIRSVARGVLGVAVIEAILIAIGMVVAGVPGAGFWTFLVLVLSIIQIPPLLVLVPMTVYVLSASEPVGITVFIICGVLAVVVDTFLKPILLGRAADAPMLVVLIGALGGMMLGGIVGLFVGAVVVTLSWELLQHSLRVSNEQASETPSPAREAVESSDQD